MNPVIPAGLLAIAILGGLGAAIGSLLERQAQHQVAEIHAAAPTLEPERFPVRTTWYGEAYRNRLTASGTRFSPEGMTAAHRSLPFGTRLKVEWLGRSVDVTITDRMPGEGLDLSAGAFRQLAPHEIGVLHAVVEVLR